jgi:hypothetical protein
MENKNIKEKKLKIAIYIVGQWRGSSFKCYEYLKEIWKDYDFYTFVHTWDFYEGKSIYNDSEIDIVDIENQNYTSDDIEKIRNSIDNLVYFEVESEKKNQEISKFNNDVNMSSFPQFYSSYKCNQYRKYYENMNGIRFDVIFKIRPDIIVSNNLIKSFQHCFKYVSLNTKSIYSKYSQSTDYIKQQPPFNLVWDHFTISSSFVMDILMEWVKDIMGGKKVYSSDYILNNEIEANELNLMSGITFPNSYIIREIFKYFDLRYFYESKYSNIWDKNFTPNLVYSINSNLYKQSNPRVSQYELFNSVYNIKTWLEENIGIDKKTGTIRLTEIQLKKLSNYLISKKDEYETKLNNL